MNENVLIINRFFESIERLKSEKVIRGLKTICDRYGINRWNALTLREEPEKHDGIFRTSWLSHLVRDYMVSPLWLLTGEGSFFRDGWDAAKVRETYGKKPEKVQIKRKRGRPRKHPVEPQLFTADV